MTLQSVTLDRLEPSRGNPRKGFDAASIEGLAASIRSDGLLHNLVVTPVQGSKEGGGKKNGRYRIVSGERRYRALRLLAERGEIDEAFPVPVEIRGGLSKDDTLRLATIENLQRQNLAPLEEADALAGLIRKKATLEDIAAKTGLSVTTIKRRLALKNLCPGTREALADGSLSLAQAEALTLADPETQTRILDEILRGHDTFSGEDIRHIILDDRPSVDMAVFPVERYTGTITTDLFAEAQGSYFDDAEQFRELQREEVEALAARHRETAAWVEVTNDWRIADWQYEEAGEGEPGGVLINLSPSGRVEIRQGLAKRQVEERTARALAGNPSAVKKAKAAYPAPLCRTIAHHKTAAVQEVLLASPRKAQEVQAVALIASLKPHEALRALSKEADPQTAYDVIAAEARLFSDRLGFRVPEGESVWTAFPPQPLDPRVLYESVKALTDHELERLHILLAAIVFGQDVCEKLDSRDTLFNRVARDLAVDMKNHWRPDRAFLERRTRDQLIAMAKECGYADGLSSIGTYKKGELVSGLLRHFAASHAAAEPTPAQVKAKGWLPEAMLFPAVDPDAPEIADEAEPDCDEGFDDEAFEDETPGDADPLDDAA